jgi:hypothetical protein
MEYSLYTSLADLFPSILSSVLSEKDSNSPLPMVSHFEKKPVQLTTSYVFKFRQMAICSAEDNLPQLHQLL